MNIIDENPEIAEKIKKMNDLQGLLDWFLKKYEKKEAMK
jgi:cell fate (sporulation/competence/biofilm development) regulator YmcA (YheA/YmcA/DUF963 family)